MDDLTWFKLMKKQWKPAIFQIIWNHVHGDYLAEFN